MLPAAGLTWHREEFGTGVGVYVLPLGTHAGRSNERGRSAGDAATLPAPTVVVQYPAVELTRQRRSRRSYGYQIERRVADTVVTVVSLNARCGDKLRHIPIAMALAEQAIYCQRASSISHGTVGTKPEWHQIMHKNHGRVDVV
jgi:hypothetical protein